MGGGEGEEPRDPVSSAGILWQDLEQFHRQDVEQDSIQIEVP